MSEIITWLFHLNFKITSDKVKVTAAYITRCASSEFHITSTVSLIMYATYITSTSLYLCMLSTLPQLSL